MPSSSLVLLPFFFSSPESMKSGGGVEVTTGKVKSFSSHLLKRSFRVPFTLLFLVAVASVFSCRTAVRRCVTYRQSDTSLISIISSTSTYSSSVWNATLLRLASMDVNEKEDRAEIEGLLDSSGESNHRSIASWRRYHRQGGTFRSYLRSKRLVSVRERDDIYIRLSTPTKFSRFFPDFRRNLRNWHRNRLFHPGVMSELVDLVKTPIDRHHAVAIDKSEPRSKFKTCAVVGNSGILLKHDHGALIDGHDIVIRLNNARTHGYHRNVGNKTSLAFINSNIFHLCARREQCYCHSYGPDVPIVMYICQAVHIMDYTICNATQNAPLLITNVHFDVLCSRIVKYYSLKRFVEETGKSPEEWDKVHDAKVFHYSSGMQAVVLALGICDQVSIFGFGKSTEAKHHYHTNQKMELSLHDYKAEYAFYEDLVERPQVIPFLADTEFTVPPVVIHR